MLQLLLARISTLWLLALSSIVQISASKSHSDFLEVDEVGNLKEISEPDPFEPWRIEKLTVEFEIITKDYQLSSEEHYSRLEKSYQRQSESGKICERLANSLKQNLELFPESIEKLDIDMLEWNAVERSLADAFQRLRENILLHLIRQWQRQLKAQLVEVTTTDQRFLIQMIESLEICKEATPLIGNMASKLSYWFAVIISIRQSLAGLKEKEPTQSAKPSDWKAFHLKMVSSLGPSLKKLRSFLGNELAELEKLRDSQMDAAWSKVEKAHQRLASYLAPKDSMSESWDKSTTSSLAESFQKLSIRKDGLDPSLLLLRSRLERTHSMLKYWHEDHTMISSTIDFLKENANRFSKQAGAILESLKVLVHKANAVGTIFDRKDSGSSDGNS